MMKIKNNGNLRNYILSMCSELTAFFWHKYLNYVSPHAVYLLHVSSTPLQLILIVKKKKSKPQVYIMETHKMLCGFVPVNMLLKSMAGK